MGAESPVAFCSCATPMQVSRCGSLSNQTVAKYLGLMRLVAGPNPRQCTAVRHSKNWYDFSGRQTGPVKGMAFREAGAVPE
jgi:hypothetical protein